MKIRLSIVLMLALAFAAQSAFATEETGKVLQSLVERVDTKLTKLEDTIGQQAKEQSAIRATLQDKKQAFEGSTNNMDKAEAKADIIGKLSELNQYDRKQVGTTLDTIVSVVGDLSKMETVLKNSSFSPEKVEKQRDRIRGVLQNVGPILQTVGTSLEDKGARRRAKSIENTLVMLYKQLSLPANDSSGVAAQVQETMNTLQDVAVQLRMVQELLELEKITLTVAAHNQIAEMVLLRMTNARLGNHDINVVAVKMHEEIAGRMGDYSPIMSSSIIGSDNDWDEPETDSEIISKIRRGQLPGDDIKKGE